MTKKCNTINLLEKHTTQRCSIGWRVRVKLREVHNLLTWLTDSHRLWSILLKMTRSMGTPSKCLMQCQVMRAKPSFLAHLAINLNLIIHPRDKNSASWLQDTSWFTNNLYSRNPFQTKSKTLVFSFEINRFYLRNSFNRGFGVLGFWGFGFMVSGFGFRV